MRAVTLERTILTTGAVVEPTAAARPPSAARAVLLTVVAVLALFAAAPAGFIDPFASFDDYPTLFGWLDAYYGKTLSEGRWVNFLWQVHVGPIGRHAAFLLVALAWSATAAIIAASVFRDDARPWRGALFAVALALAPPFGVMIAWPNTILPVMAVLLAYTAIAAWARPGVSAAALLVFAPLGLMSYTTSPVVMALALALCGDWRGFRRGAALVGLLAAGVALGLLAIYIANWTAHGVFGIVADQWRAPAEVEGFDDLAENAGRVAERFKANIFTIVHSAVWVGLVIFLATPFIAYARIPRRALPVLGVLGAGMGLIILHFLLSGVGAGIRAWPFVWMCLAALYAVMAREAAGRTARGVFLAVLVLFALGGGYFWRDFHGGLRPLQTKTAELAERVGAKAPGDGGDIDYCVEAEIAPLCEAGAAVRSQAQGRPAVSAGPGGAAIVRYPD
jgi:hypothetical protein